MGKAHSNFYYRMKKLLKKLLNKISPDIVEHYDMVVHSAAENQMKIFQSKNKKFRSYSQLKRHQKRLRKIVGSIFLALLFIFIGIVLAPVVTPQEVKSEVYIPSGKADILIANVSKNQATIVFKTFDAANDNKPLATKAYVEAFEDQAYTKLAVVSEIDPYAVTHIIPVSGLVEGKTYYIRLTATDSSSEPSQKVVSSWGDIKDPIKVYAVGENTIAPACVPQTGNVANQQPSNENNRPISPIATAPVDDGLLHINDVQNESHVFAGSKVQTIISWTTNFPASTVLMYREEKSNQEQELVVSGDMQKKHVAVLTTLNPESIYYFKAKAEDEKGDTLISDEYSLLTPKPVTSLVEKIKISFKSVVQGFVPGAKQ